MLLGGSRSFTSIDTGGTVVTAGGARGTVTWLRSSGAPFTAGESGLVQCVVWSRKTASAFELEAHCVAPMNERDKISFEFHRRTGDVAGGTTGDGVQRLAGGAGRFAGIAGECSYPVTNLSADRNVTLSRCTWQR